MDAHLEIGLPVVDPRARAGCLRDAGKQPVGGGVGGAGTSGSAAAVGGRPDEPVAGGTLVFAGARLSVSLDPALTSDGESFRVLQQIYEPLVDLAPGSTNELVGVLAESWDGRARRHEYVFHLREGVTFHDGTPFNAEAVEDQLRPHAELRRDRSRPAPTTTARSIDGFGPDNLMQSVEATDELDRDDHAPRAEPDASCSASP